MEITFDKRYLKELYETGKTGDKKHRFQPQTVRKYRKTIDLLESVSVVEDLFRYNSLHYEVLRGDKAGLEQHHRIVESLSITAMGNLGYGYTPTHPGEVLRDEIECRGISLSRLARQMGVPYRALNDILNERRSLTTRTAMRFEAALNVPADSLMRLQLKYDLHMAQTDKKLSGTLARIRQAAAIL